MTVEGQSGGAASGLQGAVSGVRVGARGRPASRPAEHALVAATPDEPRRELVAVHEREQCLPQADPSHLPTRFLERWPPAYLRQLDAMAEQLSRPVVDEFTLAAARALIHRRSLKKSLNAWSELLREAGL